MHTLTILIVSLVLSFIWSTFVISVLNLLKVEDSSGVFPLFIIVGCTTIGVVACDTYWYFVR